MTEWTILVLMVYFNTHRKLQSHLEIGIGVFVVGCLFHKSMLVAHIDYDDMLPWPKIWNKMFRDHNVNNWLVI